MDRRPHIPDGAGFHRLHNHPLARETLTCASPHRQRPAYAMKRKSSTKREASPIISATGGFSLQPGGRDSLCNGQAATALWDAPEARGGQRSVVLQTCAVLENYATPLRRSAPAKAASTLYSAAALQMAHFFSAAFSASYSFQNCSTGVAMNPGVPGVL